jgi:predicted nucleic acid-binding protein
MPIVGVVADANVLLSAVVGKAALRAITEFNIETHVSQFNVDEVAEYLPQMSRK